ncbi:MAG: hypothetical protein JNK05_09000 [Myxococcales bacterium]|nr:hypothetical protein [Myxococcales bacterium]
MKPREFWESVSARFNPRISEQRQWLVDRPNSPAGKINRVLSSAVRDGHRTRAILLSGGIGAGKSSELFRIATRQSKDYLVVVFDLEEHLQRVSAEGALERIEPWEVILLAGLGAWRLGAKNSYFDAKTSDGLLAGLKNAHELLRRDMAGDEGPPADLASVAESVSFLTSATAIAAAGGGVAAVGAGAALSRFVGSTVSGLLFGRGSRLDDQQTSVQALLAAVNAVLRKLTELTRPLLFVLDGLDRIKNIERASRLFVDSSLLTKLDASMLLSSPFAFHHSVYAQNVRGFERIEKLYNEHVFSIDAKDAFKIEIDRSKVDFFRALFDRRTTDLIAGDGAPSTPVDEGLFERLVLASGGRPRAFVRLVHLVAENAKMRLDEQPTSSSAAVADDVDEAIDEERRRIEGTLSQQDYDLLRFVVESKQHLPQERNDLWLELLTTDRVLAYSNGSEWYFPHPLLMQKRLRPGG